MYQWSLHFTGNTFTPKAQPPTAINGLTMSSLSPGLLLLFFRSLSFHCHKKGPKWNLSLLHSWTKIEYTNFRDQMKTQGKMERKQ